MTEFFYTTELFWYILLILKNTKRFLDFNQSLLQVPD